MAEGFGTFLDELDVQMLDDGRKLKLLNDYRYRDPQNDIWKTPKDWVVDGASIPQVFWSLIGGPLSGPYRNASVIHDYYCDTKEKTWQATHLTFYYGMRAGGVGEIKAQVMYYAVYKFGPRWALVSQLISRTLAGRVVSEEIQKLLHAAPEAGAADLHDVQAMQRELEAKGPMTLEQIRARADSVELSRFPEPLR